VKLVTSAEMRALEEEAERAGTPTTILMENAGLAVAQAVRRRLGGARGMRIVVLVGPGNNGGDGLVAARHLHDFGEEVFVYLLADREGDPLLQALAEREIEVVPAELPGAEERLSEALARSDAIVDAVLGTGRLRQLEGAIAAALDRVREQRAPVFAVDLPSGLGADSGEVDAHAAPALVTLALGFSKVGLHMLPGSLYAGEVEVLDIGLSASAGSRLKTELLTADWVRSRLPGRPESANKGTFGRVLAVAGSLSYTGAAGLTALGALRSGAGLVTLACMERVRDAVASRLPEVTFVLLPEREGRLAAEAGDLIVRELARYDALVIGPGLGLSAEVKGLVRGLLTHPQVQDLPVVVDADGLNSLAGWREWHRLARGSFVLTPHPGELSRLSRETAARIQSDRLDAVEACAREWGQTVVLKGAHTVVSDSEGLKLVSPFATAALAAGGTGDVLAGVIAGYLAQGLSPFAAAGVGVYIHGAAALAHADAYGESGLLASELGGEVARVAASLRRQA
jgi:ADP-dependent NAD(P)H-hydrate dehydratase / NAD(P)H-hydrate epimerase